MSRILRNRDIVAECVCVYERERESVCVSNFMGYSCTTNFVCCVVLCGFGFVTLSHGRRLWAVHRRHNRNACCSGLYDVVLVLVVVVVAIVISIYLLTAILRIWAEILICLQPEIHRINCKYIYTERANQAALSSFLIWIRVHLQ